LLRMPAPVFDVEPVTAVRRCTPDANDWIMIDADPDYFDKTTICRV